jgi:hypothetical protein
MYPADSVQNIVTSWWEEGDKKELKRGTLVYAFVPHVDQVPITLIPKGRKDAKQHDKAVINITPLRINDHRPREALPVAALSLNDGELWTAYRAKKRPCLVIGTEQPDVDNALRRNMPKKLTSPTILVAPYYGADKDGKRAGYNPQLVERIKHAEYPQFLLDQLPIGGGPKESILRFDHIQPIGLHYYAYEHSGYCLSDEAVELILNDWLKWLFYGGLSPDSFLLDFQKEIVSIYG